MPVVKEAFGKLMDEDTDSSADEQAEKEGIWDANIQGRAGRGMSRVLHPFFKNKRNTKNTFFFVLHGPRTIINGPPPTRCCEHP